MLKKATSKKMEKMSVLDEFLIEDETHIHTPSLTPLEKEKIKNLSITVDLPIVEKIKLGAINKKLLSLENISESKIINEKITTINPPYKADQSDHITTIKREDKIDPNQLVGNQRKLFQFLFENIQQNNGVDSTPLNYLAISSNLGKSTLQIKSSIRDKSIQLFQSDFFLQAYLILRSFLN